MPSKVNIRMHSTLKQAYHLRDLLNRHIRLSHTKRLPNDTANDILTPSGDSGSNHSFGKSFRCIYFMTLCLVSYILVPLLNKSAPVGLRRESNAQPDRHPEIQDTLLSGQQIPESPTSPLIPRYIQTAHGISTREPSLPPAPLTIPDPPSFALNYLDSVSLPFFDSQPAFYPELSLNDSMIFSPLGESTTGHGEDYVNSEMHGNSRTALPGRLSRLGSFSPEPETERTQSENAQPCQHSATFLRISQEDWTWISGNLARFKSVLPADYNLPSRHAFTRYLHGFVTGFHPHFPILHLPTLSVRHMSLELFMALAAVGAHYCLEMHQGIKLFHIARAIALEQIRIRESALEQTDEFPDPAEIFPTPSSASTGCYEYSKTDRSNVTQQQPDPYKGHAALNTMQALFFLMAMATWAGGHHPLVRQAISTQSVLSMLIRQHGLYESSLCPTTWEEWARFESSRRTKLVIFSFFNLHRILLNLPLPIMISDVNLRLPCTELEWRATNAESWRLTSQKSDPCPLFQEFFAALFKPNNPAPICSSLGTHIMIHALLQHILCIQQATRLGNLNGELGSEISASLEHALKKWQKGWERNAESSLNPLDKHGPIAFNSTVRKLTFIALQTLQTWLT